MKTWIRLSAALLAVIVMTGGPALAAGKKDKQAGDKGQPAASPCTNAAVPQTIEGQIVKIDPATQMITVKSSDGSTREFRASKDDLREFKVGDQLEAKLRSC